jgi:hypothetical protein
MVTIAQCENFDFDQIESFKRSSKVSPSSTRPAMLWLFEINDLDRKEHE